MIKVEAMRAAFFNRASAAVFAVVLTWGIGNAAEARCAGASRANCGSLLRTPLDPAERTQKDAECEDEWRHYEGRSRWKFWEVHHKPICVRPANFRPLPKGPSDE